MISMLYEAAFQTHNNLGFSFYSHKGDLIMILAHTKKKQKNMVFITFNNVSKMEKYRTKWELSDCKSERTESQTLVGKSFRMYWE